MFIAFVTHFLLINYQTSDHPPPRRRCFCSQSIQFNDPHMRPLSGSQPFRKTLPAGRLLLFMYNQPSGIYHCSWAITKKSPCYLHIPISPSHPRPTYPLIIFILHIHIRKLTLCREAILPNQNDTPPIFSVH